MTYTARYVDKNREAIYAIQDLFYSYFVILSGSGALTDCPSAKLIFYQIEISDKGTYNFVKKNEYQIPGDPIDIDFLSSQQLPNITQYSNFDIVNQNFDKFYVFIVYNTEIKRLEISFDIDFEVPIKDSNELKSNVNIIFPIENFFNLKSNKNKNAEITACYFDNILRVATVGLNDGNLVHLQYNYSKTEKWIEFSRDCAITYISHLGQFDDNTNLSKNSIYILNSNDKINIWLYPQNLFSKNDVDNSNSIGSISHIEKILMSRKRIGKFMKLDDTYIYEKFGKFRYACPIKFDFTNLCVICVLVFNKKYFVGRHKRKIAFSANVITCNLYLDDNSIGNINCKFISKGPIYCVKYSKRNNQIFYSTTHVTVLDTSTLRTIYSFENYSHKMTISNIVPISFGSIMLSCSMDGDIVNYSMHSIIDQKTRMSIFNFTILFFILLPILFIFISNTKFIKYFS